MKDGGVALMSRGYGEGEGRVNKAIEDALNSPLLNDNDVSNAKKILFNVSFSEEAELRMEEMNDVHEFMSRFGRDIEVIWGASRDNSLGGKVMMTILATGFGLNDIPQIADKRREEAARMTEEELRQEEERLRKEQEEELLIKRYYGDSDRQMGRSVAKAKVIVLTPEELDDDALIALIEDNPTYNRDPKLIARARSKVLENITSTATVPGQVSATSAGNQSNGGKKIISFK